MRNLNGLLRLSATDLANHLGCRHLTQLDRRVAEGNLAAPEWHDPALAILQKRGLAHEEAYVEHLRRQGRRVVELRDAEAGTAVERTVEAMREGVDVIVQAAVETGRWAGRVDLLLRVETPSHLGDWSYEVADTKLAQDTRGGAVLQLCLYSELVGGLQGRLAERMHVVKPGEGFVQESFRVAEFQAYYRLIRDRLEALTAAFPQEDTYPIPVAQCDLCRWWKACNKRRHDDDHLCLVAGMQPLHVVELQRQRIYTLEAFAEREEPLRERPERGSIDTFTKIHGQARIQLAGRKQGKPVCELLAPEPDRGFLRLPVPDPGDVFFDIEGDPFVDGGGLEYLLGLAFRDDAGELQYRAIWSLDREQEKRAFQQLIDFVMERWLRHPGMHVYHYAPYEPGAVKRLMGRYATRETAVDRLLRGKRFVDLYAVTRQGLRASVERYSLKDLEAFFDFARSIELPLASAALRRVDCELELNAVPEVSNEDRAAVELYNRDDCLATAALQEWLEECRTALEEQGHAVPRPELLGGEASEAIEERDARVQEVFDALTERLPEDHESWSPDQRARWLLAHQLDYFRREDKCAWWEFFRLHALDHEDLLEERKAVSGLELEREVGGTARCPIHRYRFPGQEAALHEGDALHEVGGEAVGTVESIDQAGLWLDIKKRSDSADRNPRAVLVNERVRPFPLDHSLLELGRWVAANGVDASGSFRAARDLLLRRPPRLENPHEGALRRSEETAVEAAVRLARELDHGVLPIQGPPGSGKTFTGARMIVELMRARKRVGVTAVSHKVVRNLLNKALEAAAEVGATVQATHKMGKREGDCVDGLEEVVDNQQALDALDEGRVVGGTAWLWARGDAVETLDYLIVDEAGQMSLAHVLAAARSARNVILLGDPQQLEQPQKGAHPEGSEVAALVHVLDGRETIPDDLGLFLDVTWRLHPAICAFTSELYYESRLKALAGLEKQCIAGETPFAGSGLFHVPVAHEGNQSCSVEEVEAVARMVESLLRPGVRWTDRKGVERNLTEGDIVIVAPYNAQVGALSAQLPDLRVGTVDKFQGEEAPVVIYSMASSSAEDAPRGMEFLYNPNRLNVATSRARCVCLLVASPRVFEPECRTPQQMRWANGLCRYRELAVEVTTAAL